MKGTDTTKPYHQRTPGVIEDIDSAAWPTPDGGRYGSEILLTLLLPFQRWSQRRTASLISDPDLSPRQVAVLWYLHGGRALPSEIARSMGIAPPVMTGVVDRLERRGFARRVADPSDRRRTWLLLTDSGRDVCTRIRAHLMDELAAQMGDFTPDEYEHFVNGVLLMDRLLARIEVAENAANAQSRVDS